MQPLRTTNGRILLHVGVEKTGSTSIQVRMRQNVRALREQGYHYPIHPLTEQLAANAKLLATALSGEASVPFAHAFPAIDVRSLDPVRVVADFLSDWKPKGETLVLTAEILRPEHASRLRALLPRDATIDVVLYVRRQDRWIESYTRQLVKSSKAHGEPAAFMSDLLAGRVGAGVRFCNWERQWSAWREAFGACNVVYFDTVPDIFAALFESAGMPVPQIPDVAPQQVALNTFEIAYLLLRREETFPTFRRRREAAIEATKITQAPDDATFVTSQLQDRVMELFGRTNARLIEATGGPVNALQMRASDKPIVRLRDIYDLAGFSDFRKTADRLFLGV